MSFEYYITPLMEQQMFDDWCPCKGNPDPRTVWAAAIDSVNGLILSSTTAPYGWMITGVPTVMKGSLAEDIQKAEAKRIGGNCKAFPIYLKGN